VWLWGVSICMGVRGGCLGVVLMDGNGSGVETLCGRELFQGVVTRWVFLWWWWLWVIPCGSRHCFSGPYMLSLTLVCV
jgi:hypothetical protein